MSGYAAIKITKRNLGAILASLSDSPGGEARFVHACLVYPYAGGDVYFIRGNYKRQQNAWDFCDHLKTEQELSEEFTHNSSDGKFRPKPDGEWFVVTPKETANAET